jgi:hypothetical protein
MEQFYIDRQFGQAIFIDVENGIVLRCYNETEKFNAKMDEKYKGNTINFLKEDFIGRAMKGVYHHLRPMAITDVKQNIQAVKSRIGVCWNLIQSNTTPDSRKDDLREAVNKLEIEQSKYEAELVTEIKRIYREHNFVM